MDFPHQKKYGLSSGSASSASTTCPGKLAYVGREQVRQAIRDQCGRVGENSAKRVVLRHDHASVYMSSDCQEEIAFFGLQSSPSFVRQPEGNGCIERFFRTLKEQLLWIRRFTNIEELRNALAASERSTTTTG